MQLSQLVALGILLLIIGGLAFTFVRSGAKVKPEDRRDDWAQHLGGGGPSGTDGSGSSS